jgi:hypothetical protein
VLAQNQAMDQYMLYGEYMPVHFVFGERNTMVYVTFDHRTWTN